MDRIDVESVALYCQGKMPAPFAWVELQPRHGSPAAAAGLSAGDGIIRFGMATTMAGVPGQLFEDEPIQIIILDSRCQVIQRTLMPRVYDTSQPHSLLGCQLVDEPPLIVQPAATQVQSRKETVDAERGHFQMTPNVSHVHGASDLVECNGSSEASQGVSDSSSDISKDETPPTMARPAEHELNAPVRPYWFRCKKIPPRLLTHPNAPP